MNTDKMTAKPLRPALTALLKDEADRCTGCGICVKECGFLKLYGNPRDIAKSYDPEDPRKRAVGFECSLCSLCSAVCPEGLDPMALFLEMRREAVERGHGSFAEHKGLLSYERTGVSKRFTWYGLPEHCDTVFFPGCALPGTRPAATHALYQQLGTVVPALGLVLDCCTKPSHDLGRQEQFIRLFEEMAGWLESQGVRRILVACPNCYKVFSEYAPQFETVTVYEVLALSPPTPSGQITSTPVTVHDPCVVRFSPAPQQAVRRLLSNMARSVEEMPHTRTTALCCGEGGAVGALAPDLATGWGVLRAAEASQRPIVTYCAGCANHLGKRAEVSHLLDIVFDTPKPSKGLVTYLNRLRLKSRFKKEVPAAITRERTIVTAGRKVRTPQAAVSWTLAGSLKRKAIVAAILSILVLAGYVLIQKLFWALNAYLYTLEFNLLTIANRLKDADLAAFVEYLRPMSTVRGVGIAAICQLMQTFAFPFSSLPTTRAFVTAFGLPQGALYAYSTGIIAIGLAACCGRFVLGDLLPLNNRSNGLDPLTPAPVWSGWCAAVLAAVPGLPLLLSGLFAGVFHVPLPRVLAFAAYGLFVRFMISIVAL